ncbi:hypothetical protein FIBSPDRAFT_887087 [Athelia psychrophila]|uniref:Uncharacterized protein n=1 Tax=Athelia psychrophila TaxID=1759441 RepID=A0A166PYE9_9AGAM|nr:hypothetical protein FIBSPDRAFT_887087 [Fibularhizoctonia sp. CBS 109695]
MSAPNSLTYAERETYRREVLNIPSPLDEWLLSNERSPRIAFLKVYLMLGDVEAEYVTCRVDMEHDLIAGIETYRLYIVAKPSPRSLHSPERQLSPRAMLAFFAGGKDDIAAPPWTQWTKTTSIFQQPVGTFATLFARMATWPLNLAQRNLSARMIMWSRIFVIFNETDIGAAIADSAANLRFGYPGEASPASREHPHAQAQAAPASPTCPNVPNRTNETGDVGRLSASGNVTRTARKYFAV